MSLEKPVIGRLGAICGVVAIEEEYLLFQAQIECSRWCVSDAAGKLLTWCVIA
jgi:hypothetical protein